MDAGQDAAYYFINISLILEFKVFRWNNTRAQCHPGQVNSTVSPKALHAVSRTIKNKSNDIISYYRTANISKIIKKLIIILFCLRWNDSLGGRVGLLFAVYYTSSECFCCCSNEWRSIGAVDVDDGGFGNWPNVMVYRHGRVRHIWNWV